MEQFYAREGNEGARRVLGYHDYLEGKSAYIPYSNEQYDQITEGLRITVNEKAIHYWDHATR